jgi:hypothetical protein
VHSVELLHNIHYFAKVKSNLLSNNYLGSGNPMRSFSVFSFFEIESITRGLSKSVSFRNVFTVALLVTLGLVLFMGTLPPVRSAISFSNSVLENSNLSFESYYSGSGNPWFVESNIWNYGGSAAQSGSMYTSDPNWPSFCYLRTYIQGPGHLYFWWKVSCGSDSWLEFDRQEGSDTNLSPRTVFASTSGETDWDVVDVYLPPGGAIYRWIFAKGALNGGSNCAWLDSVTWIPTPPVLVVRGAHNEVFYRNYNEPSEAQPSESWGSWAQLPSGSTCDSPAAAVHWDKYDDPRDDTTSLITVVRGMDETSLWCGTLDLESHWFWGWSPLDGSTMSAPTLVSNGNDLCLVVRGLDNRIYYRLYSWDDRGGVYDWNEWSVIPGGLTADSPAAAMIGNQLHVVVRGTDGTSLWWEVTRVTDNAVITSWKLISGSTPSKPCLVATQDPNDPTDWPSMLHLVVRGTSNQIFERPWYPGFSGANGWGTWNPLQGSTVDGPTAWWWWSEGTVLHSPLHIVVRDIAGTVLWHTHEYDSSWSLVDGTTPSAPTAAGCY